MLHNKKSTNTISFGKSLSKKIISKISFMVIIIFLLIVIISGFLSTKSLVKVTNDKLVSVAYENAFLISNNISDSYGRAIGFANSLRNISAIDPTEQRDAIDNALVGMLESNDNFTTVFAYFEQNTIADANGQPYSVNNRDIAL